MNMSEIRKKFYLTEPSNTHKAFIYLKFLILEMIMIIFMKSLILREYITFYNVRLTPVSPLMSPKILNIFS